MYAYSASNAPFRAPQRDIHASGGGSDENHEAAATSPAMPAEESGSERTAWQRAGEDGIRVRVLREITIRRLVPAPDWDLMSRQHNDCYKLLRSALHEKTLKGEEMFLGGSALFCGGMAYFINASIYLPLKSMSIANLTASFLVQRLARTSSETHQELKKALLDSGLEKEFIERLEALEFTEEGLMEAARLFQERTPADISGSELGGEFVKAYKQEPSFQKKVYAVMQYVTRTLGLA